MRGYQEDFYNICGKMRDRQNRIGKGEKISFALRELSGISAAELLTLRCVDVGCSSGIVTNYLSPLFKNMIGIEYDRIAMANLELPELDSVSYLRGDAMTLPFLKNSFDVVICSQVYEHVPDDKRLFAEIYRILRPGGVVFFSGPNRLFPYEFHYSLFFFHWLPRSMADRVLQLLGKGDHFYENLRTIWTLRQVLSKFEIKDVNPDFLSKQPQVVVPKRWLKLIKLFPRFVWEVLSPFMPNFNWLLYKPR